MKKVHAKRRGQRATSNIFAMFDQAQIQEFKEVGCVSKQRMKFIIKRNFVQRLSIWLIRTGMGLLILRIWRTCWPHLVWYWNLHFVMLSPCSNYKGQEPNDQVIDSMMSEAPGPLNFTMFLTLFGEKLNGKSLSLCSCVCLIMYKHMWSAVFVQIWICIWQQQLLDNYVHSHFCIWWFQALILKMLSKTLLAVLTKKEREKSMKTSKVVIWSL